MNEPDALEAARNLGDVTSVFLKSYSTDHIIGDDILLSDGEEFLLKTEKFGDLKKHGSGCVLSSAITAYLAMGADLKESCDLAKWYTFEFLKSTDGLLGVHRNIKPFIQHG